jgi:uncharacterized membrane protein
MAGIGFELREILKRDNLRSLIEAYTLAAILGSGPWILSMVGIVVIGLLSYGVAGPDIVLAGFQASIRYVIALSLILTGPFQLAFTRFTADRMYENRLDVVVPNYRAVSLVVSSLAGTVGNVGVWLLFPGQSPAYRILLVTSFVVVCNIWIATIFLAGLKQYKEIVWLYALGYGITVTASLALRTRGLEGLMFGFVFGQAFLLAGMLALILRSFPASTCISFAFFRNGCTYPSLLLIGLFYNLGVWVDKFLFWYTPSLGQQVIGPFNGSLIYDLPAFLAYLSIIPGMAVFLLRMETDFVEHYEGFYDSVRSGGALSDIREQRNRIVLTVRTGVLELIKVQAVTTLILFVWGERLLVWMDISPLNLPLLYLRLIGAALHVLFLAILNVFFYLDRRMIALWLCVGLTVPNLIFTQVSIMLGPEYYGYGFAVAMLAVVLTGLLILSKTLEELEYETFMLQRN